MSHAFARELVIWGFVLLGSTVAHGRADDLAAMVDRIVKGDGSSAARVEQGQACLERLQDQPDPDLERDLRLAIGRALVELERFRQARDQFRAAERLARDTDRRDALAQCLWERAVMSFRLGDSEDAVAASKEGMAVAEPIDRLDLLWRSANMLGLTLERLGQYESALEAFSRGLDAAERAIDMSGVGTLLGNTGIAQMNLGEYEQALATYQRALQVQREATGRLDVHSALANLGDVHFLLDDLEESYEYHREALQLREELGLESEISRSHHSIGAIRFAQEAYEQALRHFEQALEIRQRLEMAPEQAETLMALAYVYGALDRDEDATDSIEQGIGLTDRLEMKGRRVAVLESLARVYEAQGEHAKAIETFRDAVATEREQRTLEMRRSLAKFQAELEATEKEKQIAVLTREREIQSLTAKKQALVRNLLVCGSLLLALIAIAGWYAWAALRRSHRELAALNNQLEQVNGELVEAARRIKRLEGILPICSFCKSVRDESGAWHLLERYISDHSEADFSHCVCPRCIEQHYPEIALRPDQPGS